MSKDDDARAIAALLEWFATSEEAADVLPSARLALGLRFVTNNGPHGTPEQWAELLREPRKREPHLFREGPVSPEERAKRLKEMTALERLAESNKRGGKTK